MSGCYLCGGTTFRPRKGEVRDNPALHVVQCEACGLVALDSRSHIRPGHYEAGGMHPDETMEAWRRETESDDARRFDQLRPLIVNRRVLDIGSGAGGFLRKVLPVAQEATGIEPEARARESYGADISVYPSIESVEKHRFDLVTAFHVVEHLPDPRAALETFGRLLADRGRLVIEVPSADDALLTVYESDAFSRFTYWSQHLFLFGAETLRRVIEQAGLRVIAIQQFQRYPLSNHLYWLSRQQPGGHRQWPFLDSAALDAAYGSALAAVGKCDTLIAHVDRHAG